MSKRVYLSMPMAFPPMGTGAFADNAKTTLRKKGFEVVDPRDWKIPDSYAEDVVRRATKELAKSDVILAVATGPSSGQGGEITIAHSLFIPVVIWCPGDGQVSAWLMGNSNYFCRHLRDAVDRIIALSE